MNKRYNFHILEALFHDYLISGNISAVSIKNYLSDIRYYLSWFSYSNMTTNTTASFMDVFVSFSSPDIVQQYRDYLGQSGAGDRTKKRRLSSLRKFYRFCELRDILPANHAKEPAQIHPIEQKKQSIKIQQKEENGISLDNLLRAELLGQRNRQFEQDLNEFLENINLGPHKAI